MSTSLRLDTVISEFPERNNILKIYVPNGTAVVGIDGIRNRSEEEMLFQTGCRLKYVGKWIISDKKRIYEFEIIRLDDNYIY